MKVVIDTNVVYSALYRSGSPPDQILIRSIHQHIILYAPDTVQKEIERTLLGKLGCSDKEVHHILQGLPILWIPSIEYGPFLPDAVHAIDDKDDAPLVAVAILTGADIVTGDKAFHPLLRPNVKTWTPRALLDALEQQGSADATKRTS